MDGSFRRKLIVVVICIIPYPLSADISEGLRQLSLQELMNIEISTTSKYEEKLRDTPADIYVFTQKQIKERGYTSLLDILKSLPGVQIQNFSAQASYNLITTRGVVGNNKFLFLQDGVRISAPASERLAIFENFPIFYAKQIEVLMGPASVSYGADAFMGVINIITMDSDEPDVADISVTAGQDDYRYGYAHLSRNINDKVHLNLGVQAYKSQNFEFDKDFPELYDDPSKDYRFANSRNYSLLGNIRIGQDWQVGFNHTAYSYSHDFSSLPSSSAFDVNAQERVRLSNFYLRYQTELFSGFKINTLLNAMNYELKNNTYYNNEFTDFKPGYKYGNSDRVSLNQDFEFKFNQNHHLSGGLVFDYFDVIPVGADLPARYDTSKSPGQQTLTYPNTDIPIAFFARSYRNYGIYLQDNWEINPQWRLVVGFRYDNNTLYGETNNPRLSAIYKYDENNVFKILYGHAFVAPSSDQMFRHFGGFSGEKNSKGAWIGNFFQVPNPGLRPEKAKTFELNYEHWFDEHTYLKVASYYIAVSDIIQTAVDETPDQAIPGAQLLRTQKSKNMADSTSYGIDVSVANESFLVNQTTLKSWANVSFVEGQLEEEEGDSELPLTAKYTFMAGMTLNYHNKYLLTPKLFWRGSTQHKQKDPNDNAKRLRIPSYYRIDLHSQVKLTDRFIIKADIFNLFDKKYVNVSEGTSQVTFLEAPQPGRLLSFTLHYKF